MRGAISLKKIAAATTSDFTASVHYCAAIGLLMARLWLTEAVPMA